MAPGPPSVAELFSDGLGFLKSSRASAVFGDRTSSILVNRAQHVACLLLTDRSIDAFNRDNPLFQKRRTVPSQGVRIHNDGRAYRRNSLWVQLYLVFFRHLHGADWLKMNQAFG
jgi:hypothetical protein